MPLGTPYLTDSIAHVAGNGQHQELSSAALSTKYGAGNVKTPTANFTVNVKGHIFSGKRNVPFVTSPEMLAALTAAGAPIV